LLRCAGALLLFLPGNAHSVAWLDGSYVSNQCIRLLISLTLQLNSIGASDSAAGDGVAMVKGEINPNPNSGAPARDTCQDSDHLVFAGANAR
jgi:hypothetical protein